MRTVRAVFPHTAFQSVVLPRRGLTGQRMGGLQAIQPLSGNERIRPALMVTPTAPSLQTDPFTEDASQPHPYPAVQSGERGGVAVLEILKPAPQCGSETSDDRLQALPGGPFRLGPDRLLELIQALG